VPGYEVNTWFGFVAPVGTPPAVVKRLNAEIGAILADPPVRQKLAAQGFDLAPTNTPESFGQLIRDDMAKWTPVVKASGAKVD
jgi:tripartite-type tricarboxylate transporter receptor subunit TctC